MSKSNGNGVHKEAPKSPGNTYLEMKAYYESKEVHSDEQKAKDRTFKQPALLAVVKRLGGKGVPLARIVRECVKKGITFTRTIHVLNLCYRPADGTPLLAQERMEDKTEEFSLTKEGTKALAASQKASAIEA